MRLGASRSSRLGFALIAIAVLVMLLSVPAGLGQGGQGPTGPAPRGTASSAGSAAPHPSGCGGNLSAPTGLTMNWSANGSNLPTNTSAGYSVTSYAGPIPANLTVQLSFSGPKANYSWDVAWGDGANTSGVVSTNSTGPYQFTVRHPYVLEGYWTASFNVTLLCQGGGLTTTSPYSLLIIYGPYGASELATGVNVTGGTVPLDVVYTAHARGIPGSGLWVQWFAFYSDGQELQTPQYWTGNQSNSSSLTWYVSLTRPGPVHGLLKAWYPGGVVWDVVDTPTVNVTPLATLIENQSSPTGLSPWNLSFSVTVNNLNGSLYVGNASVDWNFSGFDLAPDIWETGPTMGTSIWHEFFINSSGGGIGSRVIAALVAWDGTVLAESFTVLTLSNATVVSGGPSLVLLVSPPNGTAPLPTTIWLNLSGVPPVNGTPYEMLLLVQSANRSIVVLNYTAWTKVQAWVGTPFTFQNPGNYTVTAIAREDVNGTWLGFVGATAWANVSGSGTAGAPNVALSVSAVNASGGPGIALVMDVAASGGTPSYNLTICGTSGTAPNASACALLFSLAAWSGTPTTANATVNSTGNYTIVATVQDAAGQAGNASATVFVPSPPLAAPLSVVASVVTPADGAVLGATFYFQTTVRGGTAPYGIQWSFGDGDLGSALPGTAAAHAYGKVGTFTATLTVTDARGNVATASVGPITVALATAAPSGWADPLVQVLVLGIAVGALIAVAGLGRWAVHHREAVNWRRGLEQPEEAPERSRPRP